MKDLREKIAELREHHEFEARKTMSGLNAVTKSLQSGQDYNVVKKQIQKIHLGFVETLTLVEKNHVPKLTEQAAEAVIFNIGKLTSRKRAVQYLLDVVNNPERGK